MSDPYRVAPTRPCPGCGEALAPADRTLLCDRGCGEWVIGEPLRVVLAAEAVGAVLSFEGFKDPVAKCPDCATLLDGQIWGNAVFRICRRHGVWLEAWARVRFHTTVATHGERLHRVSGDVDDQAVRDLADRLRSDDPNARLELARRIIELERRLERLEKRY